MALDDNQNDAHKIVLTYWTILAIWHEQELRQWYVATLLCILRSWNRWCNNTIHVAQAILRYKRHGCTVTKHRMFAARLCHNWRGSHLIICGSLGFISRFRFFIGLWYSIAVTFPSLVNLSMSHTAMIDAHIRAPFLPKDDRPHAISARWFRTVSSGVWTWARA